MSLNPELLFPLWELIMKWSWSLSLRLVNPVLHKPLGATIPYGKILFFSHWESQWNCSKIKISMRSHWGLGQEPHWESRTSSRTSLRIKNLMKNLIKNQDLGQDLIEILIEILNEEFFLIENLNKNFNGVLPKFLIFDEVLDEILDFWWGSWWGSWFSMRFLPKTSLRS